MYTSGAYTVRAFFGQKFFFWDRFENFIKIGGQILGKWTLKICVGGYPRIAGGYAVFHLKNRDAEVLAVKNSANKSLHCFLTG